MYDTQHVGYDPNATPSSLHEPSTTVPDDSEFETQPRLVSFELDANEEKLIPDSSDLNESSVRVDDETSEKNEEVDSDEDEVIEHEGLRDDIELKAKDRTKSSSYEDIYTGVKAPLEDVDDEVLIPPEVEIGDRYDKHVDAHFENIEGRASSFENLYETSTKEANVVEEKDVDEGDGTTDSDTDRPEKGIGEDEKFYVQSPPQMYMSTVKPEPELDLDLSSSQQKTSPSQSVQYMSPIDVTLESGLDLVGQNPQELSSSIEDRDALERSQSYEVRHDDFDAFDRHRHFSSPDDVLHVAGKDKEADEQGIHICRIYLRYVDVAVYLCFTFPLYFGHFKVFFMDWLRLLTFNFIFIMPKKCFQYKLSVM